jgi:branched-chain amino acid transport system substrate-binding protein
MPSPYTRLLTDTFRETAAEIGRPIAGTVPYSPTSSASNTGVPARVRRARPDAVFFSGYRVPETAALLKRLLRAVGPDVRILAPDGFLADFLVDQIGPTVEGMLLSLPGPSIHGLPPRGRRFVEAFTREVGAPPLPYTLYAAQATEVLLDAISQSDGTRASVARELFRTRVRDGLMPDFEIERSGDTTLTNVTIDEIRDGRPRVLRDITPPPSLVETLRRR